MGQVVAGVFCAFVAFITVVAGCLCFDWKIVGQVVAGVFCAFVVLLLLQDVYVLIGKLWGRLLLECFVPLLLSLLLLQVMIVVVI